MKNAEIARILREMADLLEIAGVEFKPQAYRRAALGIEALADDIEEIAKKGMLEEIPGIGKHIAGKIKEYIETGKIAAFEKYKKEVPVDVESLMAIEGIGPKKIKFLYEKLGIKNIEGLESAAKRGKLRNLRGFGEKTERNIIFAIEASAKGRRWPLAEATKEADIIMKRFTRCKCLNNITIAGSLRRRKETIGDIDILATSRNPEEAMKFFTSMDIVKKILARGPTKSSVILKSGMQADLRIVERRSFGAALMYFTGSKEHNIALRKIAIAKGYKLSEYGLFKNEKMMAGASEKEVYEKLGMGYIKPELRENRGEIEAALKKRMPR
jgi:DNA polymerase (family 10)